MTVRVAEVRATLAKLHADELAAVLIAVAREVAAASSEAQTSAYDEVISRATATAHAAVRSVDSDGSVSRVVDAAVEAAKDATRRQFEPHFTKVAERRELKLLAVTEPAAREEQGMEAAIARQEALRAREAAKAEALLASVEATFESLEAARTIVDALREREKERWNPLRRIGKSLVARVAPRRRGDW